MAFIMIGRYKDRGPANSEITHDVNHARLLKLTDPNQFSTFMNVLIKRDPIHAQNVQKELG